MLALFQQKQALTIHYKITFWIILYFLLWGNILQRVLSCFSMIMIPDAQGKVSTEIVYWDGRNLTATQLNTCAMNWNADCKPDLIAQQQCLAFLILL